MQIDVSIIILLSCDSFVIGIIDLAICNSEGFVAMAAVLLKISYLPLRYVWESFEYRFDTYCH